MFYSDEAAPRFDYQGVRDVELQQSEHCEPFQTSPSIECMASLSEAPQASLGAGCRRTIAYSSMRQVA